LKQSKKKGCLLVARVWGLRGPVLPDGLERRLREAVF